MVPSKLTQISGFNLPRNLNNKLSLSARFWSLVAKARIVQLSTRRSCRHHRCLSTCTLWDSICSHSSGLSFRTNKALQAELRVYQVPLWSLSRTDLGYISRANNRRCNSSRGGGRPLKVFRDTLSDNWLNDEQKIWSGKTEISVKIPQEKVLYDGV